MFKARTGITFKTMRIMFGLNHLRDGIAHPINTRIIIFPSNKKACLRYNLVCCLACKIGMANTCCGSQ